MRASTCMVSSQWPRRCPIHLTAISLRQWFGKEQCIFGSGDGNVYSLNAESGALNWKFKTGDVVHASPAIADGTVFIGSWDSYFYAIEACDGTGEMEIQDRRRPGHSQSGWDPVVGGGGGGIVYFGCRDSNLYALDESTWRKEMGVLGQRFVGGVLARGERRKSLFRNFGLEPVYALDAKSGQVEHSADLTIGICIRLRRSREARCTWVHPGKIDGSGSGRSENALEL